MRIIRTIYIIYIMPNNRHILEVEKRVHIHMFILFAKIRPYHKMENVKNPTTEQIPHAKHAKKIKNTTQFSKKSLSKFLPNFAAHKCPDKNSSTQKTQSPPYPHKK